MDEIINEGVNEVVEDAVEVAADCAANGFGKKILIGGAIIVIGAAGAYIIKNKDKAVAKYSEIKEAHRIKKIKKHLKKIEKLGGVDLIKKAEE